MITIGQLNALVGVVQGLPIAQFQTVLAEKGRNLSDDTVLAADVLADVAALLPPPLDVYAGVAATLLELASVAAVGVTITPDPLPMTDAQTTQGRGGRNA